MAGPVGRAPSRPAAGPAQSVGNAGEDFCLNIGGYWIEGHAIDPIGSKQA